MTGSKGGKNHYLCIDINKISFSQISDYQYPVVSEFEDINQNNFKMVKRTGKKINRKIPIPFYFRKSQASVSQILIASNYKRRIKQLIRNNKELSRSLQEVRCRVAVQERALAVYNQESTKKMYIKTKIKDMVTTVLNLLTDLYEVSSYMDGKTFDFVKDSSSSHDVRLKILKPNITTIEESTSPSTIKADISKDERINYENVIESVDAESKLKTRTSPRQNLITEICHLQTQAVLQDFSDLNESERPRVSKSPEHPDSSSADVYKTLQPPAILPNLRRSSSAASQNFLDLLKLQSRDTPSSSTVQKSSKVTTSKIPRRIPTSTSIDYSQPSVPLNQFSRRETFVVGSIDDEPQIPVLSTDQRGTLLLNPVENTRRSCKKQSIDFNKSSDSVDDEFDDNFAEDFTERKQFSLKPERKIINPNNKRTFVFTKKQNLNQNIPSNSITSASSDVATNKDNNIFDFSASSETEKSPVMKPKKQSRKAKKSILLKKNSCSNKHSHTDMEVKEKGINLDEVFETKKKAKIISRKSILCINKDFNSQQSSQSGRKSVRFILKNAESTKDSSNSSFEINLASSEIELNEIDGPVEQLSEDCHKSKDKKLHYKKKYSPGRCSSLKATGTVIKNTNIKITNSKKQSSYSSISDYLESNLEIEIPEEKNTKVSQKLKTSNQDIKINKDDCVYLGNSEKSNFEQSVENELVITQENYSKMMSKTESDLDVDGKINQSPKENDTKIKKTKLTRTSSGVSNCSSMKRSTLEDGLSDLDDGIFSCGTLSKETNVPDNFIIGESTEIYNVNDLIKLGAVKLLKKG
ncbi:uncharacterized protein TNCV_957261 [Trichonephila clavipes]|nr:uncharacterized protein TNCV_957261 [Trichonephila clavipes]